MKIKFVLLLAGSFFLACNQEPVSQEEHGHTHGPGDDPQHEAPIVDAKVIEGVFYYDQLEPDHPAILFAREHNPDFDEILAGLNN